MENWEKSGENVNKFVMLKFAHNFLKLLLPDNCYFLILYLMFIVKYVQNSHTLINFNKIIKIYILFRVFLFDHPFS